MQLSVSDRLHVLGITRQIESNLATLRVIRDLQTLIGFTDAESQALAFRSEGENTFWNPEADVTRDFDISPTASKAVRKAFDQFDAKETLTLEMLPLYEKFPQE